MTEHPNLPRHLRRWGLKVVTKDGWRGRGRPYNWNPKAVIAHHTASGSQSGNFASEHVVTEGRSDLPGPLCQLLLGRDGTVMIIADGYANHAGYGGPRAGIPANQGNTFAWGIEAENNGVGENWSRRQLNAYYRLCAALLDLMGTKDVRKVFGHKEWSPGRKIDPAGIGMRAFRRRVRNALEAGPSVQTVSLSKLKPGKRNHDVVQLKKALDRKGFLNYHGGSRYFGKNVEDAVRRWERSLGRPNPNGIPGRYSLGKLGFRVVD